MTVRKIKSIGDVPYPIDDVSDAFSPLLTAGAALGITGDDPTESAAWLQRTSTSDGPTTIRSIHGNTVVQDGSLLPVNMTGIETEDANGDPLQTRTIPAVTLRSAGTVYDEQTETERITRVGEVDLGTLTWNKATDGSKQFIVSRANFPELQAWSNINLVGNIICPKYTTVKYNDASALYGNIDKTIAVGGTTNAIAVLDYAYENATAAEFKAAMSGVMLYYAVKTHTVTAYDPPLNLTYRTGQGGTERVMVPTGELSAPPTLVTAQGYTAESLRDAALSAIAPVENGKASANYGVGAYLVHAGQLCKVTTSIATGESISIGTNVTTTTVMAEVLSLTQ